MIRSIIEKYSKLKKIVSGEYILIYQMGKVGSSTLESSLNSAEIKNLHIHNIVGANNYKFKSRGALNTLAAYLAKLIFKYKIKTSKNNIKIITLMRDPIARNISTLFQELPRMLYFNSLENNRAEENIDEMLRSFMSKYVNSRVPMDWFDQELKYYFEVDIFQHRFDKETGHALIKTKNIEVLLLTSESINQNVQNIAEFVNHKHLDLTNGNISEKKWYSGIYKEFTRAYTIPIGEAEKIYNSKTVKHFYNKHSREVMMNKWTEERAKTIQNSSECRIEEIKS